ncbi:hypothetical protein K4159_004720 [Salmonella enterica subsp. enterica serovar Newport]|nr:hypothetical protein [Salmonella enterica subsp. enterica serovar Newport]
MKNTVKKIGYNFLTRRERKKAEFEKINDFESGLSFLLSGKADKENGFDYEDKSELRIKLHKANMKYKKFMDYVFLVILGSSLILYLTEFFN